MAAGWQGLVSVAILTCFAGVAEGVTCTTSRSYDYHSWNSYKHTECPWGCCGSWPYQYCCRFSAGLIIGIVFACISLVFIIIALVCCCIKKQGHQGRVVGPASYERGQYHNTTVVYTGASGYPVIQHAFTNYAYPQPSQPAQPPEPPAYKRFDNPPPAYPYTDPAYPPGTSANNNNHQPSNNETPNAPPPPYSAPRPGFNVDQGPSTSRGENGLPVPSTPTSGFSGMGPASTKLPPR